ncbi:hypothetical protein [Bradyrhizobium sp. HKCCYLS2033]|uniref:hypothetical protein n=1 Tax=unclassified Bradyrhizobium TaxID=2631580 RepID=UPI003EC0C802
MRKYQLAQSVLGRLSVLTLGLAVIAGVWWAWSTSPWYLPPQEYYVTVSPDTWALKRSGKPFDLSSPYHRSLLVSGPLAVLFGASPRINKLLMARGVDVGSPLSAIDARLYSQHCGFIDDKVQTERGVWKEAALCNSGHLKDDVLQAAVTEFKDKVDAEIADYWITIVRNTGSKLGLSVAYSLGLLLAVAGGMWVVKGRLV